MALGGVSSPPLLLFSFCGSFFPSVVRGSCIGSLKDIKKGRPYWVPSLSSGVLWRRLNVVIHLLYLLAVLRKYICFPGVGVAVVVPGFKVYPLAVGLYPVPAGTLCGSYF